MRHDAKLGLALGMLVLGFAVAFCFPRYPDPEVWPRLEAVPAIGDSRLDFIPIKAYQPKPASSVGSEEVPSNRSGEQFAGHPVAPIAPPLPVPAPVVEVTPAKAVAQVAKPPAPKPVAPPVVKEQIVKADAPTIVQPSISPQLQRYKVQPGDTLSGIAGRMLGGQSRFQEIYDANRHILTDPDRLPIGMELTIPVSATTLELARKSIETEVSSTVTVPAPYVQASEEPPVRR